ncbi:MAG: 5'/3'-nucleotidase SurE [Vicinamibacterales bacterium]|nr:5'/3'-nucleotidase SurE [Vicinamibacterales bacterium]
MKRGLTPFLLLLLVAPLLSQPQQPYRILITNDDGVRAPGLVALVKALGPLGEITVVAPAENQNVKSHSLTMADPIYADDVTIPGAVLAVAVVATPATCVKLALQSLMPRRPDLVVSGINPGYNTGMVTYISGTVGAAREAALQGVPAISVSLNRTGADDFTGAAQITLEIASMVKTHGLPKGAFLNVAVPAGARQSFKGVRLTRQSALSGVERFDERKTPYGRRYFWDVYTDADPANAEAGTDVSAVSQGYVAVTPMRVGEFSDEELERLKSLKIER